MPGEEPDRRKPDSYGFGPSSTLAERYERRSLLITSDLVFSKWDRIFKDPMTTAAAIDRLVHHSVVVELNVPSYRTEQALARAGKKAQGSKRGISPQEGEAA